jgi:hypothetical protein
MRKVEPQQTRSGLLCIVHEMVVIGPNDRNEKIADRIAEPRRPERQKRLESRNPGRMQLVNRWWQFPVRLLHTL